VNLRTIVDKRLDIEIASRAHLRKLLLIFILLWGTGTAMANKAVADAASEAIAAAMAHPTSTSR